MRVHELAKITGISNADLKVECDADSHMDAVPDDVIEKYADVIAKAGDKPEVNAEKTSPPVEDKNPTPPKKLTLPAGVTAAQARISINGGGTKSKYYEYRSIV